jgi:hypothetical protein
MTQALYANMNKKKKKKKKQCQKKKVCDRMFFSDLGFNKFLP